MKSLDIPFVNLKDAFKRHETTYLNAFLEVGRSGHYVLGEKVKTLESKLSGRCGVPYAVTVGNGTDAIALVLRSLGIGPGHEVISVPNTFIGTIGAIKQIGAIPKLVDVGEDYNLDPRQLDKAYTPATKAVIPVHLTGNPCAMRDIMEWANARGVSVVEDAAQAFGALYRGQPVGSIGQAGTFSLHPLKILHGFGDGGFITTHSKTLFDTLKTLRNHGLIHRDEAKNWGVNSRMDELQAALILVQLDHFDEVVSEYRRIADFYTKHLPLGPDLSVDSKSPVDLKLPQWHAEDFPVFHNYIVRTSQRHSLMTYLESRGIETKIHYPTPIHKMACAQSLNYSIGSFPNAEKQSGEILSLPIYPGLTEQQLCRICEEIKSFFRQLKNKTRSITGTGTAAKTETALIKEGHD